MPDLRNCRRCGKMFNYLGGPPICLDCKKDDEEIFKRVKDYLYDNPGATLSEVATTLEVTVEKIKMFLKEGRLEIKDGANIILECERCGKSIKTGRYCDACTRDMASGLRDSVAPPAPTVEERNEAISERQKGGGMRYLNKNQ